MNLNDKTFKLLQNTQSGEVGEETLFYYKQEGNLVTADYYGGTIVYGKIVAKLVGEELQMLYNCLTTTGELKAGKAIAAISFSAKAKIILSLKWEWLSPATGNGTSVYIEL